MKEPVPDLNQQLLSARLPVDENHEHDKNLPARAERNIRNLVLGSFRDRLLSMRLWFLRKVMKMDIHPTVKISLKANLDLTNPRGIHIAEGTYIAFNAVVLAHDMTRLLMTDTYIGRNSFVGACSIIMPGVRVGDECVVGSGSVVTADVPSHSIVAGNPAKIIRSGIRTRKWGILEDAHAKAAAAEKTDRAQGGQVNSP
jgi:acetyltransferase-like isoleucine patch superfamily enzyme